MATQILDGTGGGHVAGVDGKNRLQTFSVVESELHDAAETGQAYTWASNTYDPDQDDTILMLKNTGNADLHITDMWISSDADTRVIVHLPTSEVTMAGTSITGINLNTGRNDVADADARRDETGNTQGDPIWTGEVFAIGDAVHIEWGGALILAKNKAVGVDFTVAATAADVVFWGFFEV